MKNKPSEQYIWNFLFSCVYVSLIIISTIYLHSIDKLPLSIPLFDFFLIALVVFRLIQLFVYDMVMDFVRSFFKRFETGPGRTISKLLSCPWCTGVWFSFFVVFFYFLTPAVWYGYLILAIAGLGSFIQILTNRFK